MDFAVEGESAFWTVGCNWHSWHLVSLAWVSAEAKRNHCFLQHTCFFFLFLLLSSVKDSSEIKEPYKWFTRKFFFCVLWIHEGFAYLRPSRDTGSWIIFLWECPWIYRCLPCWEPLTMAPLECFVFASGWPFPLGPWFLMVCVTVSLGETS